MTNYTYDLLEATIGSLAVVFLVMLILHGLMSLAVNLIGDDNDVG